MGSNSLCTDEHIKIYIDLHRSNLHYRETYVPIHPFKDFVLWLTQKRDEFLEGTEGQQVLAYLRFDGLSLKIESLQMRTDEGCQSEYRTEFVPRSHSYFKGSS